MQSLTIWGLVRRRVANSRWLLASVLAGVVAAATLVAAVPVYVSSLTQLSINLEIDNLGRSGTTAFVFTNNLILTESRSGRSNGSSTTPSIATSCRPTMEESESSAPTISGSRSARLRNKRDSFRRKRSSET